VLELRRRLKMFVNNPVPGWEYRAKPAWLAAIAASGWRSLLARWVFTDAGTLIFQFRAIRHGALAPADRTGSPFNCHPALTDRTSEGTGHQSRGDQEIHVATTDSRSGTAGAADRGLALRGVSRGRGRGGRGEG